MCIKFLVAGIKEMLLSVDIERLVGTSQLFYSNLNTTILRDLLGE